MQNILNTFIRNNFTEIAMVYCWRVNSELLPAGVQLDPGSNYHQNIQLKHQLNRLFVDGNPERRQEIIAYYIAKWGGVRTNTNATIQRYATVDCSDVGTDIQTIEMILFSHPEELWEAR